MIARKRALCRVKIPRAVRDDLIYQQRGICFICGRRLDPADVHADHIVEVSRGGSNHIVNLRAVHAECNLKRKRRYV
jgi:5-methylcytosine-specific restriction endonuclease McrA